MKNVNSNKFERSFDTTLSIRANGAHAPRGRLLTAKPKSTGIALTDTRSELPIRDAIGFHTNRLRTLMVPLDGSAFAERALPLAVNIARRAGANLKLVHVRSMQPNHTW